MEQHDFEFIYGLVCFAQAESLTCLSKADASLRVAFHIPIYLIFRSSF